MHVPTTAELVRDRLEFVEIIGSLNSHFLDPKLIRPVGEHGWTHPWKYFDSLRTYLLLTCFDLLGQPAEFLDFGTWLKASACKVERDLIFASVKNNNDLVQVLSQVHEKYLELYGARRAFYRYVEEVIPEATADALFYSISIRKIDPIKNQALEDIDSRKKKLAFLYQVRNSYTHNGVNTGSPAGGVFPDWGKPVFIDGEPKMGWEPIHYEIRGQFRYEFSVRNWPRVLIDVVKVCAQDADSVLD